MHVVIHAYNLPLLRRSQLLLSWNQLLHRNLLPQRILARKELLHEALVHHHHLHARRRVLLVQLAPLHQVDPERRKIVRRHHPKTPTRPLRRIGIRRPAHNRERHPKSRPVQWHPRHRCRMLHARHCVDPRQYVTVIGTNLRWILRPRIRHRQIERQHVIRLYAQIHTRQIPETVNRQTRSRQQYQRQRKFPNHQNPPQPVLPRARARASSLLQRLTRIDPRRVPRRRRPRQQSGECRRRYRKQQNRNTQPEVGLVGQCPPRHHCNQSLQHRIAHPHPQSSSGQRQQHALRQQLSEDRLPPRAQRAPHRQLLLPRHAP